MSAKPTEGPWIVEKPSKVWQINAPGNVPIALIVERLERGSSLYDSAETEANARLIARAVNCHDALLDACKAQHDAIDTLLAMLIELDDEFMPSKSSVWPKLLQGNAAIKLAEEK